MTRRRVPRLTAAAREDFLRQASQGTTAVLGSAGIVDDLGNGSAALRPAVHLVSTAEGVQTSEVELAFPCLWDAPWTRDNGAAPLRNTLNLVVMGRDEALIDAGQAGSAARSAPTVPPPDQGHGTYCPGTA